MDLRTRKEKLTELMSKESNIAMTGIPLQYHGETVVKNVYKIPLDYLIYNKYNGRIGTEVLSFEKQNGELNAENDKDKAIIESFLYESKKDRNDTTMASLQKNQQQRYGIVTSDGTIIDGNRRAMLLNKLYHQRESLNFSLMEVEHCKYFLAIVLPDEASERDIQQLETIYQMGEDDKLDYNPIEKYLKCKELRRLKFSEKDIADFMGESPKKIKDWLSILKLMEEYLDEYDYSGIYTRLEKTEGPFVDLDKYLESYDKRGANVSNVDWDYSESDISDLKVVSFDYIRARYEGKEFREIAKTGKDGSIFFHKGLWSEFFNNHMDNIPEDEETVNDIRERNPNESLTKLLRSRDSEWNNKAKPILKGNLRRSSSMLEDKRSGNKPYELIERALNSLQAVDCDQDNFFDDPKIVKMVMDINRMTGKMKKMLDRR